MRVTYAAVRNSRTVTCCAKCKQLDVNWHNLSKCHAAIVRCKRRAQYGIRPSVWKRCSWVKINFWKLEVRLLEKNVDTEYWKYQSWLERHHLSRPCSNKCEWNFIFIACIVQPYHTPTSSKLCWRLSTTNAKQRMKFLLCSPIDSFRFLKDMPSACTFCKHIFGQGRRNGGAWRGHYPPFPLKEGATGRRCPYLTAS